MLGYDTRLHIARKVQKEREREVSRYRVVELDAMRNDADPPRAPLSTILSAELAGKLPTEKVGKSRRRIADRSILKEDAAHLGGGGERLGGLEERKERREESGAYSRARELPSHLSAIIMAFGVLPRAYARGSTAPRSFAGFTCRYCSRRRYLCPREYPWWYSPAHEIEISAMHGYKRRSYWRSICIYLSR